MADADLNIEKPTQQVVNIPVKLDREEILQQVKPESSRARMEKYVDELIPMVQKAVRAKALYRVACVTARGDGWVEIENVRFTSKVLSRSLANVDTVFVTLMTCGKELDELPVSPKDYMRYFCLEMIKTYVIYRVGQYLLDYIKEKFELPDITHLHPGEFADLGIEQQVPLYSLFSDPEKAIGIKLTSTKTLQPLKSASGIMFYNGKSFQSCELCLQAKCPGRRAPYNPKLAEKFGLKTKKSDD
jgi:hypothetical protein